VILPTKHLQPERSLLAVGSDCLRLLDEPKTVSRLWDEFNRTRTGSWIGSSRITFDWFILAVDLLFAIGAIDVARGTLQRTPR
jgi:hypothetical protein